MIIPGICSVTFREKSPEEVIQTVSGEGLKAIEWGADVHAPPDDLENAKRVGELTRQAGLEVAGYGSYYMAFDKPDEESPSFESILAAAEAMGAPIIRIWAGPMGMEKTDDNFQKTVQLSREAAEMAAAKNIKVAFEHHARTFTEVLESALKLLEAVNHPNVYTFWQPPHGSDLSQRLKEIEAFADRLLSIHVFHWEYVAKPPYPRLDLSDGTEFWQPCLDAVAQLPGDHYALLEFVRDNSVEQFRKDAGELRRLIGATSAGG